MPNLRPYDERTAYARCYGSREGNVRIVKVEPKRPRYETRVSGEHLRQRFEERLASREPKGEEAVQPAESGSALQPEAQEASAASAPGEPERLSAASP